MYTQTSFPKSLVRSPQNPTVIILITELSILSFGQELLAKFSLLYAKFFAHVNRTVNANILHKMRVVRDQQHRTYVGGKKGGGRNKGEKCVTCLIFKILKYAQCGTSSTVTTLRGDRVGKK